LRELREIRLRRGLSQADLSTMTGVAEFTISEIEAGKRANPRPSTLRKLARALEVEVTDLYGGPAHPKAQAEWQRPSLDQVRDTFAPLADGLHRYCARWEEELPNLQGTPEEVADFFSDLRDFRAIILRVLEDELYAIAAALDLGSRYVGESELPHDMAAGFIRAEAEEHSLMHVALQRYRAVGRALAESIGDEETAESMRQALAEAG
jgi:transcriptional regulator with XRE-family HTH domain